MVLNDQKIIDRGDVDGLTAIANNANEGQPGPIILQGRSRARGVSEHHLDALDPIAVPGPAMHRLVLLFTGPAAFAAGPPFTLDR